MRPILPMFLFCAVIVGCDRAQPDQQAAMPVAEPAASSYAAGSDSIVDKAALAAAISTLASDEFGGRQPGSEGERKTVAYLVERMRAIGLAPGNGEQYTQSVPYIQIDADGSPTVRIHDGSGDVSLQVGDDIVLGSRTGRPEVVVANAPLLFAGYGIVAEEQGWNDYAGIDARGAAVVVLVNDPGFGSDDPALFKGREMTYYGRWTYKYEECARQGAAACLIVHESEAAGYGFNVVQTSFGARAQFELDRPDAAAKTPVVGWLSSEAAARLFAHAGDDLDAARARAIQRGHVARPLAELRLDAQVRSRIEHGRSDNVLGVLPGRSRADEWLIVSAHWDHLGSVRHRDGRVDIYNGAIDNAAGLAAMLAIAEALVQAGGTERSVLFFAPTLEESGLLGSHWYTGNPVQPLAQTVANINIDALLPVPATRDVWIVGYGQSELDALVAEQAAAQGRVVRANPEVEKGFYYRSDQFAFAQVGVPGLFFGPGTDAVDGGIESGQAALAQMQGRYHTPDDTFSADWNFGAMVQDIELHHEVIRTLANSGQWPRWQDDSEFRPVGEALRANNSNLP